MVELYVRLKVVFLKHFHAPPHTADKALQGSFEHFQRLFHDHQYFDHSYVPWISKKLEEIIIISFFLGGT